MKWHLSGIRVLQIGGMIALIIMGTYIIVGSGSGGSSPNSVQPASAQAASTPASTATASTDAPTTVATEDSAIPAVGQPYPSNPAFAANDITLVRTDAQPVNSQEHVMRTIADLGVPWGLGGDWEGKTVTIQSYYGLATQGQPGVNGMPWEGVLNTPLPNGVTLDHIEHRAMWIIDYGNTQFGDSGCPDCAPQPEKNHSVYLIDDETGAILIEWGCTGP